MTKTITRLTLREKYCRDMPKAIIDWNQTRLIVCLWMRPTLSFPNYETNCVFGRMTQEIIIACDSDNNPFRTVCLRGKQRFNSKFSISVQVSWLFQKQYLDFRQNESKFSFKISTKHIIYIFSFFRK